MKYFYLSLLFIACILFPKIASAHEDWRCTEQGIAKEGTVFVSCGMGENHVESWARQSAITNAENNFDSMCQIDSLCQKMKRKNRISVEPGRLSCESVTDGEGIFARTIYRCYQLIRFSLG